MEQEFTTSAGYKIFYGAGAFAMVCFSLFLLGSQQSSKGAASTVSILLLIGAAAIVINLIKRKVSVFEDSIGYKSIWGIKELISTDVKGFRVGEKAIFVEPVPNGYSKIIIRDYLSIGYSKELIAWLVDHFKDLNKEEFEEDKNKILEDSSLGVTQEDRESKFKNAKQIATVYSIAGLPLFFFAIYFHESSSWLSILTLIYPLAGIMLMAWGKGLIRLFSKKNSAHPSVFTGIFFGVMALAVQSGIKNDILDYGNFWSPFIIISLIMLVVLYIVAIKRTDATIISQIFFVIVIAGVYGFGSTLGINCNFDKSAPQLFPATVTDHHITHGKSTSYHLLLSEWGPHHDSENVSVPESFYNRVAVGSSVVVNLKKGVFNIPWFYLTQ